MKDIFQKDEAPKKATSYILYESQIDFLKWIAKQYKHLNASEALRRIIDERPEYKKFMEGYMKENKL